MPEKISILKESGETVNSNVVSVFMVPDTQKKYLISTENTVDPHGLTVLHVSEIVDGVLQKVATDEEWSSIKTIMRAIISGNVGSYQYLKTIDSIKSAEQYSRDISVSASAAKQMSDNYATRDENSIPSALDTAAPAEAPAAEEVEEVAPGIGVVETPAPEAVPTPAPVAAEPEPAPVVSAPVPEETPASEVASATEPEPVQKTVVPEQPVVEETPENPEPVQEVVAPVEVETPPVSEEIQVAEADPAQEVAPATTSETVTVTEEPAPTPEPVAPVETTPAPTPVVAEAVPVEETQEEGDIPSLDDIVNQLNSMDDNDSAPVVVEPHLVASSPVTLPVSEPAVQSDPEPVTFVAQADLYAAQPATAVPAGQIPYDNKAMSSLGIKFDVNPSFSPDASLDEVVLASQEMFIEGTRNLVQTIQEKVYRDIYNKEAELKAKEEMLNQREEALNQREKMLNEQMMTMMTNFASMQAKTVTPQQPTKVEVDSDKK